jgi:hypothetical protein
MSKLVSPIITVAAGPTPACSIALCSIWGAGLPGLVSAVCRVTKRRGQAEHRLARRDAEQPARLLERIEGGEGAVEGRLHHFPRVPECREGVLVARLELELPGPPEPGREACDGRAQGKADDPAHRRNLRRREAEAGERGGHGGRDHVLAVHQGPVEIENGEAQGPRRSGITNNLHRPNVATKAGHGKGLGGASPARRPVPPPACLCAAPAILYPGGAQRGEAS